MSIVLQFAANLKWAPKIAEAGERSIRSINTMKTLTEQPQSKCQIEHMNFTLGPTNLSQNPSSQK